MISYQYKPDNIALPRFIPRAKTHTEIKTRKEKFYLLIDLRYIYLHYVALVPTIKIAEI